MSDTTVTAAAASAEASGDCKSDDLDMEKLKARMEEDLARCLTSKTELFFRDDLMSISVEESRSVAYQEWLISSRFSHLLILNLVDILEGKSVEQFEQFAAYYNENSDLCLLLYKSAKLGPKKFYADFARWLAVDWAQVRIESRNFDGYTHQMDPPTVHVKIADIARRLIAHEEESLNLNETMFVVRVFHEMWCRPLETELKWKSMCACPYDRENVSPHRHHCSGCGKCEATSGDLKVCARCNQCEYGKYFKRYYCNVQCQKDHWLNTHRAYHQNITNLLKIE